MLSWTTMAARLGEHLINLRAWGKTPLLLQSIGVALAWPLTGQDYLPATPAHCCLHPTADCGICSPGLTLCGVTTRAKP